MSLTVQVVDDPPQISAIPNQTVYSGDGVAVVPFTVSDEETDPGQLGVSVASADAVALPTEAMVLGGAGVSRTLSITPQPGVFATVSVTVTATDGVNSVQRVFSVQLAPTLAYRIIALPVPVGTQVTQPTFVSNDGRVGGFGEPFGGGGPRAFVNLGYLNGFATQADLLTQNNGRVNGMAVANGLQVSVGEYFYNNEWRAFLHNGGTFFDLGKPAGSSGSRALAVNASLQVVGFSISGSNERAFLSTGNPDAFTDISPSGTTTSRAVAINDGGVALIRSGTDGSYRAWRRASDATTTELVAPSGYSNPNPLSIASDGTVMAELTGGGGRRLARWQSGTWTVLSDSQARWAFFNGGRLNSFGLAAATARATAGGTPSAVVYSAGSWYALGDLISEGTGWTLETATSINDDGMIVGTGRRNGVALGYLAVPANIIGQRVLRPQGAAARYPTIQILEGGVDDGDSNSFVWSELEKSLYAIRPVTARILWFTTTDLANTTSPMIPSLAANIWPRRPFIHVATAPVDTEPADEATRTFTFASLAYSTDREASVDPGSKRFNSLATNGNTYSVFRFLRTEGRSPDPLFQTNAFMVVRTVPWNLAPLATNETAVVGQTLTNSSTTTTPAGTASCSTPTPSSTSPASVRPTTLSTAPAPSTWSTCSPTPARPTPPWPCPASHGTT